MLTLDEFEKWWLEAHETEHLRPHYLVLSPSLYELARKLLSSPLASYDWGDDEAEVEIPADFDPAFETDSDSAMGDDPWDGSPLDD